MKPDHLTAILDDGLDELAANAHAGFWPRVAINAATAAIFAMVLPWTTCLAWGCVTLALEGAAWFVTRRQYLGRGVGWRTRLCHVCIMGVSGLAWVVLGALAWETGALAAMLCAVVVWLAVVFFAQTHAHQSALGIVVGGAAPAAVILAVVLLAPHPASLQIAPLVATLLVAFVFAGDGVARMMKARRNYREAKVEVERSEALYRLLADNITDVITLADATGKRLYMSPSIERALGYPLEQLYEMPIYGYVHPEDCDKLVALTRELAVKPRATAEYRVIRADGASLWVETSFNVVGPEQGVNPPQVVSVARVVQQRKQLEAELISARQAAEAAAAAKSDFLANMTHELRTPLNAIIGFAGLLRDSPRLEGQDARHARLISNASDTLLALVNDVLDFSRLEAGAVELDPAPFDPRGEAEGVVDLLSGQAAAKGLALTAEVAGEGLLTGDAKRLRQVMLNLISNAVKFTAKGSVTLRLGWTGEGEGMARLRTEVVDTGVGIAASQAASLFERFTQADVSVSRRFGGTGLGLAICKRIIELMGGRIGLTSVEGGGSTFWFELQLPTASALEPKAEPDSAAELSRPVRLLLVEDVAVNRELVKTVLAPFDIEIDTAEDGVAAIAAFRDGVYDLVLMDVQMPVMDGLTATRRIRALGTAAADTTPIVAMTANVLPEQIARCVEAGMDGHLGKPMNPAELLATIAHWSTRRRDPDATVEATVLPAAG